MTGALSFHYARALADAVFRPNAGIEPAAAVEQLRTIEGIVTESKDLQIALLSPAANKKSKVAILRKLSDELGLHRLIRNFLSVVVAHRRTQDLRGIRQSFEEVVDERTGWTKAEITSALELSPEERQDVERALGTKIGKFIRAEYKVDPALLGGVLARVAEVEYDATLKGKLEDLRQRLYASF